MLKVKKFPTVRKHTLAFLHYSKQLAPVTLSAEIDMTKIVSYKNNYPRKLSYISFLTYTISRVLSKNKHCNLAYQEGLSPKVINYQEINAKLTLSKIINNEFTVVSAVLEKANELSLESIQDKVDLYKNLSIKEYPSYSGLKLLQTLPQTISNYIFKKVMSNPRNKMALQGSFTITSLGHQPIDLFVPISGTTLTFGVGQVRLRPVVSGDHIIAKSTLVLTMVFDHRVLDGFLSAKLLSEIKFELENFITT